MAKVPKHTLIFPIEQSVYIDTKGVSGSYASSSKVIRTGLRSLQERDASVERWLRDTVVPIFDVTAAKPGRKLPARAVLSEVRIRFAAKVKARR